MRLREAEQEIPSATDIKRADNLKKPMESVLKSMENLIMQLKGEMATLPMCELLGLYKQLRSICVHSSRNRKEGSVRAIHQSRKAQARGNPSYPRLHQYATRRNLEAHYPAT